MVDKECADQEWAKCDRKGKETEDSDGKKDQKTNENETAAE